MNNMGVKCLSVAGKAQLLAHISKDFSDKLFSSGLNSFLDPTVYSVGYDQVFVLAVDDFVVVVVVVSFNIHC